MPDNLSKENQRLTQIIVEKEKEKQKLVGYLGWAVFVIYVGVTIWTSEHPFVAENIFQYLVALGAVAFFYNKFPLATSAIVSIIAGAGAYNLDSLPHAVVSALAAVACIFLAINSRSTHTK